MTPSGDNPTPATPTVVPCPQCGKKAPWQGNPWRPFCSERCKQIDLGAWADDEYRLPSEDSPPEDPSGGEE